MKFNNFVRQSSTQGKDPPRITFRMITPNTTSIWFSHEVCFGKYTNRIRWLDSDKNACRLATDFSNPRTPLPPRPVGTSHASATSFTKLSEQWMFKLSTTNTHEPSGSTDNVC